MDSAQWGGIQQFLTSVLAQYKLKVFCIIRTVQAYIGAWWGCHKALTEEEIQVATELPTNPRTEIH